MTQFNALITGSIAGALMKASEGPLLIEVFVPTDDDGNYLSEVLVRGKETDEWLRILVEPTSPPGEHHELTLEDRVDVVVDMS